METILDIKFFLIQAPNICISFYIYDIIYYI